MTIKEIREKVGEFILAGNSLPEVGYTSLSPVIEDSTRGPYENLVVIQDVAGKQQNYCNGNDDALIDLFIYQSSKEAGAVIREALEIDLDSSCYEGLRFMVQALDDTYMGIDQRSNLHVYKTRLLVLT